MAFICRSCSLPILMLTSKGMAGAPRASLVVIAATLGQFNIPEAGLLLIIGVDHFLDMGRKATNVQGNAVASAAVAKWENVLAPSSADVSVDDAGGHHKDGIRSDEEGAIPVAGNCRSGFTTAIRKPGNA